MMDSYLESIPAVARIVDGADALDVKSGAADLTLREFAAGFLSYQPGWVTFLYRVRSVIVPFLALKQGAQAGDRVSPYDRSATNCRILAVCQPFRYYSVGYQWESGE